MKHVPVQAVLPFGRKEKVLNRQMRERAEGKRVRRGPGRPKSKNAGMSHQKRPVLGEKTAVHVTVRASRHVPNLRTRRRFSAIKKAFVKFCRGDGVGFRLVHFAVLSNHVHFVVEADGRRALSMGMQKVLHSVSRRLNALNVKESGAEIRKGAGGYAQARGWLGRVFSDRYHSHVLKSPTEMQRAIRYVVTNAEHHYGATDHDPFTSMGANDPNLVTHPRGFLLMRACRRYRPHRCEFA